MLQEHLLAIFIGRFQHRKGILRPLLQLVLRLARYEEVKLTIPLRSCCCNCCCFLSGVFQVAYVINITPFLWFPRGLLRTTILGVRR